MEECNWRKLFIWHPFWDLAPSDERLPGCFIHRSEDSNTKGPSSPSGERNLGTAMLMMAVTSPFSPSGGEFTNQIETSITAGWEMSESCWTCLRYA